MNVENCKLHAHKQMHTLIALEHDTSDESVYPPLHPPPLILCIFMTSASASAFSDNEIYDFAF